MEENKNIFFKHSLESYNKKYRNRRHKILKYTKKQVEEFDKKYQGKVEKNYLLKGRKWTLIGDTYYQIPKAPGATWFRNLKTSTQVLTCALLGCAFITGVAVPTAITLRNHQDVKPTPPIEEKVKVNFIIKEQGIPGADPESIEVVKGNKIAEPEVATIGKTLEGWYTTESFDPKTKWDFNSSKVTSNTNLYAKFTTDTCTVTFDCNGGAFNQYEEPSETVFPRNSLIDKPQYNPVYSPNGFLGWTKTKDGTDYWDFTKDKISLSTATLTLYAKWETVNVFTVNFYVDTSVYHAEQVISGEKVKAPANPSKDGFQFMTWNIKDTQTEFDFSQGITANTDLSADFAATTDSYKITGEHNMDCDAASASLTKFAIKKSTKVVENDLPTVTWSTDNALLTVASDGTPTVDKTKLSSTGGNKVMVSATIDSEVVDTFDVEVASFDKFNKDKLAEGVAVAIDTSVTGDVYIPSRYHNGEEFGDIKKIGEGAFKGCDNIKVYIPIPTIIIEKDAFKAINNLDLAFADTSNTWFFEGYGECVPDPQGQLSDIIAALKTGVDSSKAPTNQGLKFEYNQETDTYNVYIDKSSSYQITDLLIPAYYYEDGEGGHTRYKEGYSKKVVLLAAPSEIKESDYNSLKSVTFHSECNLKEIGFHAFYRCRSLENVYFDDKKGSKLNIETIGYNAFYGCSALKEFTVPKTVTKLGDYCFDQCTSLKSFTFGMNVKTVGTTAFQSARNLSTLTFPDKCALTYIGTGAFKDCSGLHQLRLPYNLIKIDERGFLNCTGLNTVEFADDTSLWYTYDKLMMSANKNRNRTENAKNITQFGPFEKTNPEILDYFTKTKNSDGSYTLSNYSVPAGMSKYTNIDIPSSYILDGVTYPITCIAAGTFKDNTDIQKVTIPDTVSRIESDTFANCSNLTSVVIPESVNYIGKRAFQYCSSLNNADFGDSKQTFKLDIPIFTITIDFNPNDNKSNASKLITVKYKYLTCALIKA